MNVGTARAWCRAALAAIVVAVVLGAAVAGYAAKEQEPIRRVVYGSTEPQNAPGQSMTLQQVEIDPGAKLPPDAEDIVFLASDAARMVTGETISADGGTARTLDLYGGAV